MHIWQQSLFSLMKQHDMKMIDWVTFVFCVVAILLAIPPFIERLKLRFSDQKLSLTTVAIAIAVFIGLFFAPFFIFLALSLMSVALVALTAIGRVKKMLGDLTMASRDLYQLSNLLREYVLPLQENAELLKRTGIDKFEGKYTIVFSHISSISVGDPTHNVCALTKSSQSSSSHHFSNAAGLPKDEEKLVWLVRRALGSHLNPEPIEVLCSCELESAHEEGRLTDLQNNLLIIGDVTRNPLCKLVFMKNWLRNFHLKGEQRIPPIDDFFDRPIEDCKITRNDSGLEYKPSPDPRPWRKELPQITYSLLTRMPNPWNGDKVIILAAGCKREGQEGLTYALTTPEVWKTYQRQLPDMSRKDLSYQILFEVPYSTDEDPSVIGQIKKKEIRILDHWEQR